MSTALTVQETQQVAMTFARSGLFAGVDPEKAFVAILAGRELGLEPFQSVSGIHIIKGKPVLSATLLAALVKRSARYDFRTTKHDATECVLAFFESGNAVGESSFSIGDARQAGLLNNPVWGKFPRNMLFARALSNGVRWYCSDVTMTAVYYEGELAGDATTPEPTRTVEVVEDAVIVEEPTKRRPPHLEALLEAAKRHASETGTSIKALFVAVAEREGKPLASLTKDEIPGVIARMTAPTYDATAEPEPVPASKTVKTKAAFDRASAKLHATCNAVAKLASDDKPEFRRLLDTLREVTHFIVRDLSGVKPDAAWKSVDVDAMIGVMQRVQALGDEISKMDPTLRPSAVLATCDEWREEVAR